jgi:hypothetical protein
VQYGKVYRSADGGSSWSVVPSDGLGSSAAAERLWLSPGLPDRIFVVSAARGALIFDLPNDLAQVNPNTSSQ